MTKYDIFIQGRAEQFHIYADEMTYDETYTTFYVAGQAVMWVSTQKAEIINAPPEDAV